MPRLVVTAGQPDAGSFHLIPGVTTIGRADQNGLRIDHRSLSRVHARLEVTPQSVTVIDLRSKNGTFVNGVRVERSELKPGDQLQCGDVVLTLSADSEADPASLPTVTRPSLARYSRADFQTLLRRERDTSGALRLRPADEAGRTRDKLQILLRVSQLLSAPESTDRLLHHILELAYEVFDIDLASIYMVDPATDRLERRAIRRSVEGGPETNPTEVLRIASYVRENRVAALFSESMVGPEASPSMCAPFAPRDRVLGILYLENRSSPGRFSEEDLEFLTSFANQAAVAIENAQLYERIEREAVLRNNLLRFFPPSTIKRLQEQKDPALGTIDVEVTALFCDISGFTSMAEELPPREIVGLLNEYFPVMADIVFRWEGTLEKYIGDAMLAVWGAPFGHPDDPDRALAAAIDMQRALEGLNRRWMQLRRRPLSIHIGVNTGHVAAGNIGSDRYVQYATIGDATNVAARLCNVARGGEIVASQSTLKALQYLHVDVEELQPVIVKGKEQPLRVHRVNWLDAAEAPGTTQRIDAAQ
jgi:adenylate cyclase